MFSTKKNPPKVLGDSGEDLARSYLKANGFSVLDRNFSSRGGEIDLIAEKKGELHFIEVKTRKDRQFGQPFDAIDYPKRKKMASAAHYYLLTHQKWDKRPKFFSVISIDYSKESGEIEFFPNAFEIEGEYY